MVGLYHQLNGHEFEQTLGVKGQEARHAAVHEVAESDRTTTTKYYDHELRACLQLHKLPTG